MSAYCVHVNKIRNYKMAMQKLNVRFSDETKDYISNTAVSFDLFDSHVARAALNLGLKYINEEADKSDSDSAKIYRLIQANQ